MYILCGVKGKWGGAKHLRELETHDGNADITRWTNYADQKDTQTCTRCMCWSKICSVNIPCYQDWYLFVLYPAPPLPWLLQLLSLSHPSCAPAFHKLKGTDTFWFEMRTSDWHHWLKILKSIHVDNACWRYRWHLTIFSNPSSISINFVVRSRKKPFL